ncbi:MAG: NADH-quinone oxidoreductase subunit D [Armatimonadetes bacterium]|nr:NADH-quinone oxidoreductase subunit D [Armatimonadota bacterium]
MGPQHPSTHGVLRVILTLDGEWIVGAEPDIGYLHRSFEKMGEMRTYTNGVPLTDRWDYLSSMSNNLVYSQAVEELLELEVPSRAQFLRVIVCELNRIASHLVFVGTYGLDLGANTPFLYCFRDREKILDLYEAICGVRLTYSYIYPGGVTGDAPPGWLEELDRYLDYQGPMIDEIDQLLTGNEIFILRTRNIGVITAEQALDWSLSGPMLRASGVKWDLRKERPYQVYDQLDFEVPTLETGDCLDRYLVRVAEMRESLKILKQCLAKFPEGPVKAKMPKTVKPPPGEIYTCVESPRGELGVYMVSDGTDMPYRQKIRGPAFVNLSPCRDVMPGWKIADAVAILGSMDVVMGEVDR